MRVLVTGSAGQLGSDVAAWCDRCGDEVVAVDRRAFDVGDRDVVLGTVGAVRPDVIVNCAAFTDVDGCETEIETALRINGLGPRHVAEAARRFDAHLVHVSTDYVFSGEQDQPYIEWDEPDPHSVYGRSKLAGEREVGPASTIVRTSWLCGEAGSNMVGTILRLASEHPTLRFVDDQRGHPTFTADLAPMIRRLAVERRPGLYHVTNQGAVSWYDFACEVVAATGRDPGMVEPITTAQLAPPRPAPRPANSVLDNAALRLSGIPLLRDHREPLRELVATLGAG